MRFGKGERQQRSWNTKLCCLDQHGSTGKVGAKGAWDHWILPQHNNSLKVGMVIRSRDKVGGPNSKHYIAG
jgi:hypothetical protein